MLGFLVISSFIILSLTFMMIDLRRNRKPSLAGPGGIHDCESYIEKRLYNALVYNGYTVHTQVPCGSYRIDLALPAYRVAIECDGKAYHSTPEQKAHDRRKNAYLRRHGWKVLRFSGRSINGDLNRVLKRIKHSI
ncbi:DUF559 domain-containing protein [Candidatus Microgenomates bacterium]|nr:MAG: DUF559 domain-containing protein [Candidatus Microgenomates bacterium]